MTKTEQTNYKMAFSTLTIKNNYTTNKNHNRALEVKVIKIKSTIKNPATQVPTNKNASTRYGLWDWD